MSPYSFTRGMPPGGRAPVLMSSAAQNSLRRIPGRDLDAVARALRELGVAGTLPSAQSVPNRDSRYHFAQVHPTEMAIIYRAAQPSEMELQQFEEGIGGVLVIDILPIEEMRAQEPLRDGE